MEQLEKQYDTSNVGDLLSTVIKHGDASALRILVESPEVDVKEHSSSALVAATGGHEECLRVVKVAGCDLGQANKDGNTPALFSCIGGHVDCMALLRDAGCGCEYFAAAFEDPAGWVHVKAQQEASNREGPRTYNHPDCRNALVWGPVARPGEHRCSVCEKGGLFCAYHDAETEFDLCVACCDVKSTV